MILAGPMAGPSLFAGASSAFAVWGLPTNFAAFPESHSHNPMPVGIIDYGVPIVDAPLDVDEYVTLPGLRKEMIFDPGESRVFRDPLRSNAERFRDPKVSWLPDMMSLKSVAPRVGKNIVERGDNFIAIDNGYHPQADVSLIIKFMESHAGDRIKRESEGDEVQVSVALAKDRLWIPVQADPRERKLFFRKRDIPALLFVAKMEYGSKEVVQRALRELHSQAHTLDGRSPPWLQFKMWAARELSIDMFKFEASLHSTLSQECVKDFFAKTWQRYSEVEKPDLRTRKS